MKRIFSGLTLVTLFASSIALLAPAPVSSQTEVSPSVQRLAAYWAAMYANVDLAAILEQAPETAGFQLLARAQPDQCDYGLDASGEQTLYQLNIGSFMSTYPGNLTKNDKKACLAAAGRLKTNQAYVWGLTESGGSLWFGTIANTLCIVMNGVGIPAHQTDAWTCEGGIRDNRPPRIFTYNLATNRLADMTGQVLNALPVDSERLLETVGLRSAGAHGGVVFLGGIGPNGVNLFAFNAATGAYIGSDAPFDHSDIPARYTNIRQFIVANGQLYVGLGVGQSPLGGGGAFGALSGEILRWTGTVADPFQFELVSTLAADPAYLVQYQNRIAVSTWGEGDPYRIGGQLVYLSPEFGDDGMLTEADGDWNIIWRLSSYEIEPSALQFGGAIGVVNDYLVWGTMFIPASGTLVFEQVYPDAPSDQIAAFLGTYRPITIFRAANAETLSPQVDILYGNAELPKFDPGSNEWFVVPNGLNQAPLMGPAGFGNFFNNYTWWMTQHGGKLFIGTMDYLFVAARLLGSAAASLPTDIIKQAQALEGADVWSYLGDERPAFPLTLTGAGNIANYGIRTMIAVDSDLYLGSANPMNLLMKTPLGGWELIKVVPQKPAKSK